MGDLYCSDCYFYIQMFDSSVLLLQTPMLALPKYSAKPAIIFLDSIMSVLVNMFQNGPSLGSSVLVKLYSKLTVAEYVQLCYQVVVKNNLCHHD